MSNTPPDPELSEESPPTDSRRRAVQTAVETFLRHVRRVVTRGSPATDATPTPVLMTDGGQDDAKVIGHNQQSGQTVGVWGEVDSSDGCGFATPDDVRIDGTVLTNETDFIVEAGTQSTGDAQNVVLGHASNTVDGGKEGVTIAGGGLDGGSSDLSHVAYDSYGTIGGGLDNQVGTFDTEDQPGGTVGGGNGNTASGVYGTVGGGLGNTASGEDATVGGGQTNTASGEAATVGGGGFNTASGEDATVAGGGPNTASSYRATVGGGSDNTASDNWATVAGGFLNTASGNVATVPGGAYGAAESNESFVWNDASSYHAIPNTGGNGLSSDTAVNGEPVTGASTFSVSATGGVRFITGNSSVTYIDGGTAGWSTSSTRTAKTNIDPVDPQQVLDGVEDVEVATWEYKNDDGQGAGTTHVGPMAEEFHGILDVDLGSSDEHINSLNADGTLFAAVQGLAQRLNEETDRLAEENEQLNRDLDTKDDRIDKFQDSLDAKADRIEEVEAENDELRERLADIEAHLGIDDHERSTDD
jgi:hypothetical protein